VFNVRAAPARASSRGFGTGRCAWPGPFRRRRAGVSIIWLLIVWAEVHGRRKPESKVCGVRVYQQKGILHPQCYSWQCKRSCNCVALPLER
jgi:hypothetical protein